MYIYRIMNALNVINHSAKINLFIKIIVVYSRLTFIVQFHSGFLYYNFFFLTLHQYWLLYFTFSNIVTSE